MRGRDLAQGIRHVGDAILQQQQHWSCQKDDAQGEHCVELSGGKGKVKTNKQTDKNFKQRHL